MKKTAIAVFKVAFAAAILVWMVRSGRLNLGEVAGAFSHWPALLLILLLVNIQIAVSAWRWKWLLRAQSFALPFRQAYSLTMIGALFNVVIPGAVGGDVIKAYYIARGTTRKAETTGTIVLDRVAGLVGLFLLAAAAALWNLPAVLHNRALLPVCGFALAGAAGGVAALVVAVRFGSRIAPGNPKSGLARVLAGLEGYRRHSATLPLAIAVSVACHLSACTAVYLAFQALDPPEVPVRAFLLAVPLGLMATALPISPAGIGVGQAAFFALFQLVSPASASPGAGAFTVYQTLFVLVYLTGFIPYLAYKHTPAASRSEAVS